jgi:hypothetical protein
MIVTAYAEASSTKRDDAISGQSLARDMVWPRTDGKTCRPNLTVVRRWKNFPPTIPT